MLAHATYRGYMLHAQRICSICSIYASGDTGGVGGAQPPQLLLVLADNGHMVHMQHICSICCIYAVLDILAMCSICSIYAAYGGCMLASSIYAVLQHMRYM